MSQQLDSFPIFEVPGHLLAQIVCGVDDLMELVLKDLAAVSPSLCRLVLSQPDLGLLGDLSFAPDLSISVQLDPLLCHRAVRAFKGTDLTPRLLVINGGWI